MHEAPRASDYQLTNFCSDRRAMDIYDELIKRPELQESLSNIYVFKACCLYALCQYKEAKAECEKATEDNPLKMRLLF